MLRSRDNRIAEGALRRDRLGRQTRYPAPKPFRIVLATVLSLCSTVVLAQTAVTQSFTGDLLAQTQTVPNSSPGNPKTGGGSGDQLAEVVVTAQFRNENVQETPLAITAINAQMLEERNQTNLAQVAADVPSVTLLPAEAAFGPSMTASIRGIGQYDFDPALEPGVGIYVDDVYYATLTGSLLDLLDLDRVEILRGPQGTLEGMNSIGGAVKLFSQKPTGQGGSSVDVLYGSRNHVELRAGTDFTVLPDQVFVRMSGVFNHQDGYENVFDFGCANPSIAATATNGVTGNYSVAPSSFLSHAGSCLIGQEGGTDYGAIRLSVRWTPSDQVDVNFVGDITQQNQENPATTLLYANLSGNAFYNQITIPTTSGAQLPYNSAAVPAMIPRNPYSSYATFSMPAFGGTPAYAAPDTSSLLSWGGSGTVDWKINDIFALKSITAFRGYSSTWNEDNDASPWPVGLGAEYLQHHQFSQEIRLNGSWEHLVDFTVGGFFFNENSIYGTHQDLWYAAGPGALDFLGYDPVPAHDRAGFVHTVWHLTDKLDLTGGVRYTYQNKDYTYTRVNPEGGTGGSAALVGGLNGYTGTYSDSKVDWRADIDYHWTDDLMTYVQASTGFKGGGVNPRPFFTFQAVKFNPETVTNYEVGIKSTWLDHHLTVNLDGYYAKYRDIQLALLNCDFLNPPALAGVSLPCALPFNAGDANIKGIELETQARPLPGLQLDASGSYLQFGYTSLSSNPTGVTFGMTTPYTPKWQGTAGIQYSFATPDGGSLTPRFDGNTRSQVFTNPVNGPLNRISGYTVLNGRVTWKPAKDDWQVSLEALNLGGKFYYLNKFDLTGAGGGSVDGTPAPPREIDIEIKHKM
jgi:iron complex outermembrane recepter protein